jgi:hypothetical protein
LSFICIPNPSSKQELESKITATDVIDYQGLETFDLIAVYDFMFFSQCYSWSHNIKQVASFIYILYEISGSCISVSREMRGMIYLRVLPQMKVSNILRQLFSIYKFYLSHFTPS